MPTDRRRILWADDQIDELKSQILFLQGKGFDVVGVSNGDDALDLLGRERFDALLLDEQMPGRGGLETLAGLRDLGATLPVIMITKSEEEELMDKALGRRITDYLVKPVNPTQILMALKRALDASKITEEQVSKQYLQGFQNLAMQRMEARDWADWSRLYDRMVDWEAELQRLKDPQLAALHADQVREANAEFNRFIEKNYEGWIGGRDERAPVLSHHLVERYVAPHLRQGHRVVLFVIDCMRLDQWRAMQSALEPLYVQETELYCSILPTATPFSRNALFAGLLPRDIAKQYPQYWRGSAQEERSKNAFEKQLLQANLERLGLKDVRSHYFKTFNTGDVEHMRKQVPTLKDAGMIAVVVNFLDILAHGRSQNELLRELAPDETAFRSLMRSWFEHSALHDVLRDLADWDDTVVIVTTDHGSVQVRKPTQVKANRDASTNVRYKYGDNLNVDRADALDIRDPERFGLPKDSPIMNFVCAREYAYFVYPTNYNEYVRQYRDSFQHGGISLEEMVVPLATLRPR
jgi:CheY-like chemotaxis protein